jgi:DNA mismatch repair protein MSH4
LLGLQLAKLADLPDDVIIEATKVAHDLAARHSKDEAASQSSKIAERRKALIKVSFFFFTVKQIVLF